MTRYRLHSDQVSNTVGIVRMGIALYPFSQNQQKIRTLLVQSYDGLSEEAAHQLLSRQVPYWIEGEAIVFDSGNP